jgi:class 3 adenylate cyclase
VEIRLGLAKDSVPRAARLREKFDACQYPNLSENRIFQPHRCIHRVAMKPILPHRLLLARFFSQGLISAAVVILLVGVTLTWLEQENYLRHATNSASERITRIATHIGHQIENPSLTHVNNPSLVGDQTCIQVLVTQEVENSGLLKLQILDEAGLVLGSSIPSEVGKTLDSDEISQVENTRQVTGHVVRAGSASYLHFAAPILAQGKSYIVVLDEPLSEMVSASRDIQITVTVTLSIGFASVFVILGLIVRRAGLDIENHQQEEARVKDLLGRYVSHQVASQILEHGGLKVGGERRFITVLFPDIRGFTTLSEELLPEQVVEILNECLAALTEVVFKYDGTVDKFLGDGLMAIFGAPLGHDDDIRRAIDCAREMQLIFDDLHQRRSSQGLPTLGLGIGINTGDAVVGNVGSVRRLDYTAIGDTVNTAQRLQNLAEGGQIIISQTTYARLNSKAAEPLGPKQLKGKSQPLEVFCLNSRVWTGSV